MFAKFIHQRSIAIIFLFDGKVRTHVVRVLSKTAIEKKAGFIDESDNRKTYNLYNEAVTDADAFNKESKTYNAICKMFHLLP